MELHSRTSSDIAQNNHTDALRIHHVRQLIDLNWADGDKLGAKGKFLRHENTTKRRSSCERKACSLSTRALFVSQNAVIRTRKLLSLLLRVCVFFLCVRVVRFQAQPAGLWSRMSDADSGVDAGTDSDGSLSMSVGSSAPSDNEDLVRAALF